MVMVVQIFWVFSAATPTSISRGLYLLLKVSSKGLKSCSKTAAENIIQSFFLIKLCFYGSKVQLRHSVTKSWKIETWEHFHFESGTQSSILDRLLATHLNL